MPVSSRGSRNRPGCFAREETVPAVPALAPLIIAVELLTKSGATSAVSGSVRSGDLAAVLPLLQETADQSGVELDLKGTPTSVTVRFSPSRRRSR